LNQRPEQFAAALERGLPSAVLLHGDEPLQLRECLDALRRRALVDGYTERLVVHGEAKFDWASLSAETDSLSLFAERRLFEVHLTVRPGADGAAAIERHANGNGDDALVVICPRLDAAAQRTAWFKRVARAAEIVAFFEVTIGELPRWLSERFQAKGLQATGDACELLAERTEGNLLAAAQEVEKLVLLAQGSDVDVDAILDAGGNSARFNAFDLVGAAMDGDGARTVRVLRALREGGLEVPPLLGSITWTLRNLCAVAEAASGGQSVDSVLRAPQFGGLRRRGASIRAVIERHSRRQLYGYLRAATSIDRTSKGREAGDPWAGMERLCLSIAGNSPLAHV
jgi:DNA polymerase III subunit delta